MNESDLFHPLRTYLEGQGYSVHSEVKNCDIAARKKDNDELLIIELKRTLSLKLVLQAVRRKELTDAVYIAVPLTGGASYPANFGDLKLMLRRLEIGLIFVRFLKTKTKVEIVLHPAPFTGRRAVRRRMSIIREIDGRYAEFNTAGEPAKTEKITAYKQESLRIAALLNRMGTASPKQLREAGCSEKTQIILSKNIYGWFDKIERGLYRLHETGRRVLQDYADEIETITGAAEKAEQSGK